MAPLSAPLARVAHARARTQKLERDLSAARNELRDAIIDAREAGESFTAIARVLGVSRQRVTEVVERGRS